MVHIHSQKQGDSRCLLSLRTWTSHDLDIWRYLMSYTLTSFHHLPSIHYTYRCHSWGGGWQPMTKTNRSTPARAGPVIVSQCAYCIPLLRVLLHPWWQTVLFTTRVERMSSLMCAQVVKGGRERANEEIFLVVLCFWKSNPLVHVNKAFTINIPATSKHPDDRLLIEQSASVLHHIP